MTDPNMRHLDDHSRTVLTHAIRLLAILRSRIHHDQPIDPADTLHLAWSLSLQIDHQLPDMIGRAVDHGYHHDHIRDQFTRHNR